MPNWLYWLLSLLVDLAVCYWVHRRAYKRGFEAAFNESLDISRQVDDILQADRPKPNSPIA